MYMKDINIINSNFTAILTTRQDIQNVFHNLSNKLSVLKEIYSNLLKTHNLSKDSLGIDSFFFQNALFDIEYQNMFKMFAVIDNRLYGEYYKLYKIITRFINSEIKDPEFIKKINLTKTYPAYKNLELMRKYDIELTIEIQNVIVKTIIELNNYNEARTDEINADSKQSDMGLNIDNLINTQIYNNVLLKEKINMFIRYLFAFHEHHTKYFKRLSLKLKLVIGVINEDIILSKSRKKNKRPVDLNVVLEDNGSPTTTIDSEEEQSLRNLINVDDSLKDTLDSAISSIKYDEESDNDAEQNDAEQNDAEQNDVEQNDVEQNDAEQNDVEQNDAEQNDAFAITNGIDTDTLVSNIVISHDIENILSNISDEIVENFKKN